MCYHSRLCQASEGDDEMGSFVYICVYVRTCIRVPKLVSRVKQKKMRQKGVKGDLIDEKDWEVDVIDE